MRIRSALVLCTVAGIGILSTGCDAVATYYVDNQTGQALITRALFEGDCTQTSGYRDDYLEEYPVARATTSAIEYIYGGGPESVSCIQVLTGDRRLILADSYHNGATYAVVASAQPTGDPVIKAELLPNQGFLSQLKEGLSEHPVWTIASAAFVLFGLALIVGIPLATLVAFFVIGRDLYRRYVKKPRPT